MKVAVTGGNGFLAGYLNRELKEKGIDSVLLIRSQNKHHVTGDFTVTDYSIKSLGEIFTGGRKCHCAFSRSQGNCLGPVIL